MIKVHLYGSYFVSRGGQALQGTGAGRLWTHDLDSGLIGNFGQAGCSAARLGIMALSKSSIALGVSKFDVRSNCIAPLPEAA